jgi:cytochrome b
MFAAGMAAALLIAFFSDDDGALFSYHAIIGLTLVAMVLLRIVWGAVGSRHARFASFPCGASRVLEYARGVVAHKGERYVGHNPGSAYAMLAMLAIMLGLGATGLMMSQGGSDDAKNVHELLAYAMLAVIGGHLLGLIVHKVRHGENIGASMVHGYQMAEGSAGIGSGHPVVAGLFVLMAIMWAGGLLAKYDASARATTIPLIGVPVQLGEAEGGEASGAEHHRRDAHHHDHDDD